MVGGVKCYRGCQTIKEGRPCWLPLFFQRRPTGKYVLPALVFLSSFLLQIPVWKQVATVAVVGFLGFLAGSDLDIGSSLGVLGLKFNQDG